MPKNGINFPDRLEYAVSHEMRVSLIALGFLTGSGASYARIARNLMQQAIDTAVAALSPERRKAYDEILANVEIAESDKKR